MFALRTKQCDSFGPECHRRARFVLLEILARTEQISSFGCEWCPIRTINPDHGARNGAGLNDVPDVPPGEPVDIGSDGSLGLGLGDHGVGDGAHGSMISVVDRG